jgi:hypothetical protein
MYVILNPNDARQRLESRPEDIGLNRILCDTYRRKGNLQQAGEQWEGYRSIIKGIGSHQNTEPATHRHTQTITNAAKPRFSPGLTTKFNPANLFLLHPFHHSSQRVFIHRRHRVRPHLLDPSAHSLILDAQPVARRRLKHIAKPDLLRRDF